MKKDKLYFLFLLFFAGVIAACSKDVPPYEELTDNKEGAMVFVAKAHSGIQNLTIFPFTDLERTFRFNAGFGAVGLPAGNIGVSFSEDVRAFDSLNTVRQANGLEPYQQFPQDAYHIDKLKLTIPKGGVSSDFATLTYRPQKFDNSKNYLLALSINDASDYSISPMAKTVLIVTPKLEERPANTSGWIATASTEQPQGENTGLASAVLDGNLNTIWHARYNPGPGAKYPHWLSFDMINSVYVTKVAMAPRQNNPRGFTKFKLEGSLDGNTWFLLGDNLTFDPANKSYQSYSIEPQNLKKIKITMLEGLQDLAFLSEFVVYTF